MLPLSSEEISASKAGESKLGSANRSPTMIAKENAFFECNLDIFSKAAENFPSIGPVTMLNANRKYQ